MHRSIAVQSILRENGIAFKFLPPYSPKLNPIEEFFSMIKSKFKAFKREFPRGTIESVFETIFREDFSNECGGFLEEWMRMGLARQFF